MYMASFFLKKKKEQSLKVSLILFDLSRHIFLFFLLVETDLRFACWATAVIDFSLHYSLASHHVLCINIDCCMQLLKLCKEISLSLPMSVGYTFI